MNAFIVTSILAFGQPPASEPAAGLDGNWIVVSFEKSGQVVAEAKDCLATIKDNVIVFSPKNEKTGINSMKLEFAGDSTVRVTEIVPKIEEANPPKARPGVYILSHEYVAISIRDTAPANAGDAPAANSKPVANAFCTFVMKRVALPERK